MTLEQAIRNNPYNPNQGNLSAYCRYLRYNVDGFYTKTNDEVKKILKDYKEEDDLIELKSFAIEKCEKIPSNDKILMSSFNITHSTTKSTTDSLFEKHTITIEWIQIVESEERNDLQPM